MDIHQIVHAEIPHVTVEREILTVMHNGKLTPLHSYSSVADYISEHIPF